MNTTQIRRMAFPAVLAIAALWAGIGKAEEASPGITDTTIRIGISGPLTGPVAAIGALSEGVKVKAAAINAAGGVKMGDGKTRKLEIVVEDDGIDPQRTLSNVRKMVEKEEVFGLLGIAGTPNNQAIGKYIERHKVPDLFMYSGVHELPDGKDWLIGLVPSFTTEGAAFADYLKKNKPDAKVALLFLNTETGQTFQAGLKSALDGSKIEIVAAQPVTPTDPTIDTQLSTLKASGADTLVVIAPPRQGAQAVRFASESGWHPTTLVSYIASSVASLKPAGLQNAKDIITSQFIKPIDDPAYAGDAGVKQYLADCASAKPSFTPDDSMGQIGYVSADALIRVLEAMKQPTRQAMMEAARNMPDVEIGLFLPGIKLSTKSDSDIYPIESLQLFQFDGEKYHPIGGLVSFEGGKTPRI